MNSNITIHIVEPGDITPVPDTGLFTHGVGGKEAAIITIFSLAIIASLFAIYYYHKKHKQAKKHSAIGLFILALLASLGTFTAFILNSSQSNISAVDLDEQSANLIVDAEDTEITVELDNEPVFAYVPVKVTVPKATESGYTLKAYSEHPTLSSDTTDKTIDLITIPEDGSENANTLTTALLNNTWGLSLEQPTSQDNQIYYSLPNNLDDAIVIKSIKDTTPANDETIVYYGFYITPDTPYGTYTGAVINYEAEMTMATVIYNGNGLYFNNNPEQTTNDVDYITGITEKTVKYSHTPNVNDEGEASGIVGYHGGDILNKVITIPGASKISIKLSYGGGYISGGYPAGFVSFWQGTHPDYTTENNIGTAVKTCGTSGVTDGKFYGDRNNENTIITTECELEGNAVTFAYWTSGGGPSGGAIYGYYATVTGYDADGNIIYLPGNTQVGGEYKDPAQDLPYIFLGWNEDKEATVGIYESKNDIEINLPLTKGKTTELYAIWQHATKIHLDGNGSTSGEIPDKLLAPGKGTSLCGYYYTRDGYIFNNWNTKPDGSGESYGQCYWYTAPADQSIELNLYAQWSPATTIVYDGNGGEGSGPTQDIRAGETSNIYGNWGYFNKDGYAFSHWNTKPDGTGTSYYQGDQFTASDQPTSITLYAQWAPATTIVYDGNGGEGDQIRETIRAGETGSIRGNWGDFFKEGYAWNSWNTQPDGSGTTYYEWQEFTAPDQSQVVTLYAQWSPATTIIYDGNGYDWGGMGKQTIYPGNTEELWNNDYHKNGYYFTGWNTQPDGSGISYNNYQSITAPDQSQIITLYAQWMPEGEGYYTTITFNGNGADGGEMQSQIVAAGQTTYIECANYWKDNHWFFGWNTDPDGNGTRYDNCVRYTAPANETNNIALYAIWAEDGANTTIVYDGNGADGGYMDNQTIWAGNTEQIWGANYWKNYYNFIGWNTESDGSGTSYNAYEYYTASNITETITLYAQWEEILHTTITFNGNGSDGGSGLEDRYLSPGQGTNFCNYDNYTRTGYYFTGWNTAADGSGTYYDNCQWYNAPTDGSAEFTLYAQWSPATTFVFDGNGNTSGQMQSQNIPAGQGNSIWCANGNYFKDGYYSFGWNTDPEGNGTPYNCWQWYEASDQSEVITLYAQWTPATTIIYDGNGADWGWMDNETIPAGNTWELWNNDYHKEGYYFAGWNTESDGTGEPYNNLQSFTASDESQVITLYAQWTPEGEGYYTTITFDGNGADGGEMQDQIVAAGQTMQTSCINYWKDGYYFAGWNTDPDGNGTRYDNCARYTAPANETNNITLYAIWAEYGVETTIFFDANGGEGWMDEQVIYETQQLYCNDYWKEFYTFAGWNTESDGSGVHYDNCANFTASSQHETITLYAQWEEQAHTTFIFDGNGANSGEMPDQTIYAWQGDSIWCGSDYYQKDGYYFVNWNTDPYGNGTTYDCWQWYEASDQPETITLYAQWADCTTSYICYKSNGADGSTSMQNQYADSNTEITLWASNFSYTGHGFVGWSEDTDASTKLTDSNPNNDPLIYGPNQTITTGDMSRGMGLYAVWLEPAKDINNNPLTFQTENLLTTTLSDNTTLASKSNGYVTALKDERDNQVYAVAKLADGNYWMIENLRLDNTAEITLENTNNPYQTYKSGPGSDMVVGIRNNDGSYYNHLSPNSDNWCTDSNTRCYNQSYLNTNNTAETASEMSDPYNYNIYSYGNYYNWYSATAGQNSQSGDICPAGWQLPYGGSGTDTAGGNTKGGFYYLNNILNGDAYSTRSNNWRSFPNNFIFSGYWYGSSVSGIGDYGYYWSSTAQDSYNAYMLNFDAYVYPGNRQKEKNSGGSIRCVAQIITTIIYDGNGAESGEMQNQKIIASTTAQLNWNTYSRIGYIFVGWNTEPDGSGIHYDVGSDFTAPSETQVITLYAQWEKPTTIIFDGNGNTGGEGLGDRYLSAGGTTQLCGSYWRYGTYYYYTKTNHQFIGWNTEPDGSGTSYADCAEFTAPVEPITLTLYAQWQPYTKISFNSNGGEGDRNDEFIEPGGSREFCNYGYFTKTNYYFYGWNTEPDGSGTSYSDCVRFIAPTPSVDITLYAQWTSVAPNKISYNANGADGTTTMADQQLDSYQEVTLWASNFSYSGHGFAGWSEDQDAAAKFLDNDPNNDPVIYGPNQNVNIDPNTGGMNLYAVWLEPAKDVNNTPLTFQTENLLTTTLSDNTTLASKPNGYVTALIDERDNQVYAIAKLADGNYWMIENLRLDNSTTNESTTAELSSTNTNNPSLPLTNVYGSTTSNRLSASSNNWCYNNNAGCINQSKINTNNTANTVSTMNSTDANIYSYGNYYNWYSATAGNGTYNTTSGNVAGDLCPAGWQLPIGNETNDNGSFSHLDVAIGGSGSWSNSSARLRSFPNNFIYSGYSDSGYPNYRGTYGRYWSSTARNSLVAYQLLFYYNDYYPGTNTLNKRYGGSIRCVAPINSATSATSSAFSDNSTDSNEAPSPEEPLGEYQSSTTTGTEGTNIITPLLIAVSTALGTSALVLLAYKSRHKEE